MRYLTVVSRVERRALARLVLSVARTAKAAIKTFKVSVPQVQAVHVQEGCICPDRHAQSTRSCFFSRGRLSVTRAVFALRVSDGHLSADVCRCPRDRRTMSSRGDNDAARMYIGLLL